MVNRFTFDDPFTRLGLPLSFNLDKSRIDAAYYMSQTKLHPDRFVNALPAEKEAAERESALINEAYSILKDPVKRAACILRLQGIDLPDQDNTTLQDPEILEEMMELQEALSCLEDPQEVRLFEEGLLAKIEENKAAFSHSLEKEDYASLPKIYIKLSYLSKLLAEAKDILRREGSKAF